MGTISKYQTDTSTESVSASRRAFLRGRAHVAAAPSLFKPAIGDSCLALRGVDCRVCGEACGAGAIRFYPRLGGVAQPVLVSDNCTACGDCIAPCPVGALGRTVSNQATEGAVT